MCRTTVVLSLIALAGCGKPAVAIEYRGGNAFSDSERGIIAIVANRAAIDARKLLPALPANLRITVQAGSGVIAETGENGSTGLPAAVYWTVDPNHEGGVAGVVKKQLRATLFHEWYHLLRETTFAPATIAERAVNEGLATAFERDFGGAPTPWGDYPPEIAGWTRELLSLTDDAPSRQWMFEHPDGRRWIGFKVGTYLADRARAASGLSLAELATVPTEKIIAMANEGQALDDGRRWLSLRSMPAPSAPALLRAAAANARNQTALSERLLLDIIRTQPTSEAARGAHTLLSRIYLRSGQYRRAIANLDAWARDFPNGDDVRKERSDVEQFRGLPDQINGPVGRAMLSHGAANDFNAPLSINGRPAAYLMDTGAWVSVMTEAEAKRFGLTVLAGTAALGETSGKGVNIRMAVARDLVLGGMTFHDVSFAVLPDVEPWRSMDPGRQGIVGMPILLSAGCIRWTRGGAWEIGCTTDGTAARAANLVFYENKLLVTATVFDEPVFLTLDTGAETTDLNTNFARQFKTQVERLGTKDTTRVSGLGGTAVIDSLTLPAVTFGIAGSAVPLRPAHVTLQENAALGGRCCIGNLGLDVLLHAGEIVIDLSSMTLRFR